jgi:hypothetical protein
MLILIPHRDSRRVLRSYSGALFDAGLWGAWSFPRVIPLALLEDALNSAELKRLAHTLRELSLAGEKNGMMRCLENALLPLNGELSIFGPRLELSIPPEAFSACGGKIACSFPRLIFGAALIPGSALPEGLPPAPPLAFRAAALANMHYQSLSTGEKDYSFRWQIGSPSWLPSIRRKKRP